MKRKLTSILLMSALLVGGASTFVSCKDYDGDQAAQTIADLTEVRKIALANQAALFGPDGNGGIVGDLKSLGLLSGSGFSDQFKDDLANLSKTTTNAREALAKAIAAQSTADEAKAWIEANTELELLKNHCAALADIAGCKDIILKLNDMKSIWGDDLSNVVVRTELAEYLKTADLEDKVAELGYEKVADMKQDVRDIINDWTAEIAGEEGVIKDYASLVAAFNQLPEKLVEINNTFEDIYEKLGIVNQMVAGLVTDINIDMVENPFWGTLNTPFGIKSTVLVGYVGGEIDNDKAASFGAEEGGLAQSATGGSIFLTLNPNDIEAEGMNFALVGRDGEEAPGFELASLVKDNSKVTTITTRAAAKVNGYKADFALNDGKKAMVNVDKGALKDVATNVLDKLKGKEALDITSAVQTIYSTFANAVDQYYALQAAWKETQLDGTVKDRAVVSDYNIAAVTVKPLGYNSLNAVDSKLDNYNIPQIPLLQDVLGAYISDVKFDPINTDKLAKVTVTIPDINKVKIEYKEGKDNAGTIHWTTGATSANIELEFDNLQVTSGGDTTIDVPLDELVAVVNQLNGELQDVNKLIDKVDELAGRADSYISKVNKVLSVANKFIHKLPQFLQPVVVAVGSNGAVRLSEVDGAYTQFTGAGSLVLVPTSYTAELLAPSFKKSIKVDNGKELVADCDGTVKTLSVELAKGKHTISYRTMDYYGTIVEKKYYVEVK